MGRTSDYTKQVRNEEYENIAETTKKSAKSFADIKRMFAKEPMTAEQFGIYLGGWWTIVGAMVYRPSCDCS